MSYSSNGSGVKTKFSTSINFVSLLILFTLNVPTMTCSFLLSISNVSPILIEDSCKFVFVVKGPSPVTWNLELVLYFQVFANICL